MAIRSCSWLCVLVLLTSPAAAENAPADKRLEEVEKKVKELEERLKTRERIKFDGLLDAYFAYRPQGGFRDGLTLRAYDTEAGGFALSAVRLGVSMDASPVGYRFDIAFGALAERTTFEAQSPGASPLERSAANDVFKHIPQAYVTFKLPTPSPLVIDVGRFYSSVNTELINNNENWNYSHSWLFGSAEPYTHTGVRATLDLSKQFQLQLSVVNGWDSVLDENALKTVNLSLYFKHPSIEAPRTELSLHYYGGPEAPASTHSEAWRSLFDLSLIHRFEKSRLSFNAVYGLDGVGGKRVQWYGAALQGQLDVTDWLRLAMRLEYFGDPDGVRTALTYGGGLVPVTDLGLTGFTFTVGFPIAKRAEIRLEARHDYASQLIFRGDSQHQTTLTTGVLAFF